MMFPSNGTGDFIMAVYGYIRVSTAKQVAEDTPDTQRDTIERLATEHGLLVDRIFED
ncbi:recombinase family protein, partial [Klebsiella pneumoniae]|nr:recombinase family protein [Klebsiella pneumoniae]